MASSGASLVARALRVRAGEGRLVALVVSLTFVSMAAITVGESGVNALFFDRVGARALPLMYLLQGATTFVVMLGLTAALGTVGHRRAYLATPLVLGVIVVIERAILLTGARWIYAVLWVTVAVATLVLAVSLWGTAGAVVDTRQAKRLFPIFAGGGILGSVVGGLLTPPLAAAIGAQNLLLVWAGGLAAGYVFSRVVLGRRSRGEPDGLRRRTSPLRDLVSSFAFVRRSRLLVWMTVAAVLFSILFYSLYLPYAQAASDRFPDADDLAGFFGLFWAGVTAAAFVVSMLLTNRLFAWFGIATMVVVLPALYIAAFGVLLVTTGFVTLVGLRFTIGTWLQGVASPGWETLTNVIPESRRDQTRAFLNGGPTQVGTVIAGVVALVGQNVMTLRGFAIIGLVAAVLTLLTTVGIRRSYTGALVDALREGRPQVFEPSNRAPVPPPVDADAVAVLEGAIRSPEVRERRLAVQLLADLPVEARPSEFADAIDDDDSVVRLAVARALDPAVDEQRKALSSRVDDEDGAVAAAAAARALTWGDDRADSRLRALLAAANDRTRLEAIQQLGLAPPDRAAIHASSLLDDPSPDVRAAALELFARAAPDRAAEVARSALGHDDPLVRSAAGRALALAGCTDDVLESLTDGRTVDAAVIAVRVLDRVEDDRRIRAFVESTAARSSADRDLALRIPVDDDVSALLRDTVLERGRRTARAGLWAITLIASRRAEMEAALERLDGGPGLVATALETLESAGDAALVRPLVALWEPLPSKDGHHEWLPLVLRDPDGLIKRCAEAIRSKTEGGTVAEGVTTLSSIERILFLRRITFFSELAPSELDRIATMSEERTYLDGEILAAEGDAGEDLFIVVDGEIRVVRGEGSGAEIELARRSAGDVVGEMAIITHEPRFASLVATGSVRTLRLGHREFRSILRERPSVALGVMTVLARRLAESHRPSTTEGG